MRNAEHNLSNGARSVCWGHAFRCSQKHIGHPIEDSRPGQITLAVRRTSPSWVARSDRVPSRNLRRAEASNIATLRMEKTDPMMHTLHTGGSQLLLQLRFLGPLCSSCGKSTQRPPSHAWVMRQSTSPACEQGTDLVRNTIFQNFQNTVRLPAVTRVDQLQLTLPALHAVLNILCPITRMLLRQGQPGPLVIPTRQPNHAKSRGHVSTQSTVAERSRTIPAGLSMRCSSSFAWASCAHLEAVFSGSHEVHRDLPAPRPSQACKHTLQRLPDACKHRWCSCSCCLCWWEYSSRACWTRARKCPVRPPRKKDPAAGSAILAAWALSGLPRVRSAPFCNQ